MRVALYTSDQGKDPGHHDNVWRRDQLVDRCREKRWKIVAEFEDTGRPEKGKIRQGLRALLRAAKKGEFQLVLVAELDRITTGAREFLGLIRRLDAHDIDLFCWNEAFRLHSVNGALSRGLLEALARMEPADRKRGRGDSEAPELRGASV